MACYSPLAAWQLEGGEVVFAERGRVLRPLQLPCGQCIGCRIARSQAWAVRVLHESQMHSENSFVTLTYDDDHIPNHGSLNYKHFQKFMKRLRKAVGPVRFYMCGEYGEQFGRPHFHACIFGCGFNDRVPHKKLPSGFMLYTSELLSSLWTDGFSSVADVTFESAAYVARYCMKKITGPRAEAHYARLSYETGEVYQVEPEFNRMSLKPGIGADFFEKYHSDITSRDRVVIGGRFVKPPKYYDKLLEAMDPELSESRDYSRFVSSLSCIDDTTPDRLRARDAVTRARYSTKVRSLE